MTKKLTDLEFLILNEFVGKDEININELIDRIYQHRLDGGPDWAHTTVWVTKFKLNKKLELIGLKIVAVLKRPCKYRLIRL